MSEYVPTEADIEHCLRVRAAGVRLGDKLMRTVPREALDGIGASLGLVEDGVFVFDTEDVTSVLMDSCLHDWVEDGRNLTQKYAEENPTPEDADEREALDASLKARYTLLMPTRQVPGAGVYATDLASEEELFLMDVGLSNSSLVDDVALATRIKPLGEFWMTGGAALPVDADLARDIAEVLSKNDHDMEVALSEPAYVLEFVRACLDAGMASHIKMSSPGEGHPGIEAGCARPSRNAPCPCGSGTQHKRCCGRRRSS